MKKERREKLHKRRAITEISKRKRNIQPKTERTKSKKQPKVIYTILSL